MRIYLVMLIALITLSNGLKAQTEPDSIFNAVFDSTEDLTPRGDRPLFRDTTKNWTFGGNLSLYMSQTSFVNWAAGGQNSFSLNSSGEAYTIYEKGKTVWLNDLRVAYGLHKQGGGKSRKDNDELIFLSKVARNTRYKRVFTTAMTELRTQMFPGYNLPNDSTTISGFFSPAYLMTGVGIDYVPVKDLRITIAPVATKFTFVVNDSVASRHTYFSSKATGSKYARYEFGGWINIRAEGDLSEIVEYETQLGLFSNYFVSPQNIDVDWRGQLNIKLSKIIAITLHARLVYDDDVDTKIDKDNDGAYETNGPRIQFKEVTGAGILLEF